ncbi:apolipoprotein D and lipocalin family protein [Prosthecobacter fusiformis]|uniref:Apolipoprotein D and lipocalin family protein n=1 Tax=Prosthecobacter fusiformis TaxID=48464 RepID=A0A4R7S7W6_9BACT|nr:lipocalin family protein [Prosthecobacter fusiformis]TDU73337.1 apolipoprotein D and lipocalin family protein [Prosthecobacter fusiformis]
MKIYSFFIAAVSVVLMSCSSTKDTKTLPTAAKVDIQRYMGQWYEIFRLPNQFQRDDSRAEALYTMQPDGTVKVLNTEIRPDGTQKKVSGTATAISDGKNSRLRVTFEGLASLVPVSKEGNYWIIRVAPDYSTALVGTPDRKYLWLLSRTPQISPTRRSAYESEAARLGFDTKRLLHQR